VTNASEAVKLALAVAFLVLFVLVTFGVQL
jgi:hypothetical protein